MHQPRAVSDLGLGVDDTCGAGGVLTEDSCQTNGAAMCQGGGIYDNDETIISSIVTTDVVCTAAIDINATTTALNGANTTLLNAGQISYLTTYGGAGWAYVRSMIGAFYATDATGVRNNLTRSDMIVGKLEYTEAPIDISGGTIGGEVNDFKWIRNSASLWDEDWILSRGISSIMQADGFGD